MAALLQDRCAVVTGGTGALGRAIVKRFAAEGASVHVPWIVEAEVQELQACLGPLASAVRLYRADLADERAVNEFFQEVSRWTGRQEILANICGGFAYASLEETDVALWRRMFEMNATSAFLSCRAAVPGMKKGKWGRIINVAAQPALNRGAAMLSAYSASKAAVLNLTYSLAEELRAEGITVNAIVPTIIDTPANRKAMPQADTSKWLPPEQIAEVLTFLASSSAGIVNGTAVNLSNG